MSGWPPTLSDYRIEERDTKTGEVRKYTPQGDHPVYVERNNTKESENAAELFYSKILDYEVGNTNHRRNNRLKYLLKDFPSEVKDLLEKSISQNVEVETENSRPAIDVIDQKGIPDLFMYKANEPSEFQFVEVKRKSGTINKNQRKWINEFNFLPVKVTRVIPEYEQSEDQNILERQPDTDGDALPEEFIKWKQHYRKRPAEGKRSENDGVESIVTLVHYGLKGATGYDTNVIESLTVDVVAASLAAIRNEGERAVHEYIQTYDGNMPELKSELQNEFTKLFGTKKNPQPVVIGSSAVGGVGAAICAMLKVLDRADPLEETRKYLDGETK